MENDFDAAVPPVASVAAWLRSTPPSGTPLQRTLQRHFPGALPGYAVLRRLQSVVRQFGLAPENTIYGQSICPDEINNERGDLASLMQDYWGKCFPMGGIGGAPFVGQSGFMAFSQHVPDNGHVLILFGPHVAISESGELGRYRRMGQRRESAACGAVLAAYRACCCGGEEDEDPLDMQQCWLKQQIRKDLQKIEASSEPLATLTYAAYQAVESKLLACVNHHFGRGKLVLLGGIQINMPAPYEDHFCPLTLRVSSWDEEEAPRDYVSTFSYTEPAMPLAKGMTRQSSIAGRSRCNQVFSWLNWCPRPESPCFQALHEAFPGAVPGQVVLRRSVMTLERFGLRPGNTIYGQSICPDEINNEKGDLSYIMKEHWGNCFPMGGIGGAPYVGKTGFSAFSQHVPDDGHVLILFGPHVAITESGELGQYRRIGQACNSPACGAVLSAYRACCSGWRCDNEALDMQQTWLCNAVESHIEEIRCSDTPVAALTRVAYEAVKEKMLSIVNHDFGDGYLVLIGGIQINMPAPFEDAFQPLLFQIRSKAGVEYSLVEELMVPR